MAKFVCESDKCEKGKTIVSYIIKGNGNYLDRWDSPIICECGSKMSPEEVEHDYTKEAANSNNTGVPFSSRSKSDQKKILKQRSANHSRKNKFRR